MKAKVLGAVAVCLLASGCMTSATYSRITSYPPKVHHVKMADDTYRVFEHKTDKTLMTTTSIGSAVAVGAVKGATLGLAETYTPEQRHEAAAQEYLNQTGRSNCRITKGYLLAQPQYEFHYSCP